MGALSRLSDRSATSRTKGPNRDDDELLALAAGAGPDGHKVVVGEAADFAALGLSVERLGDWPTDCGGADNVWSLSRLTVAPSEC
jgi:hypothetical protein